MLFLKTDFRVFWWNLIKIRGICGAKLFASKYSSVSLIPLFVRCIITIGNWILKPTFSLPAVVLSCDYDEACHCPFGSDLWLCWKKTEHILNLADQSKWNFFQMTLNSMDVLTQFKLWFWTVFNQFSFDKWNHVRPPLGYWVVLSHLAPADSGHSTRCCTHYSGWCLFCKYRTLSVLPQYFPTAFWRSFLCVFVIM